ncbi:MAG TPA: pirin family protein [Puia sp.]|nr:pirin family protein [Puia sp.]
MQKKIEHILLGREKQITPEEKVRQPLPHAEFRFANPFIVVHHMGPETLTPGGKLRIHPHPHRGFSPVTFQLQGEGYHKDNAGHEGIIRAGDVQWMFAGKGILHSEGPTQALLEKGGVQELIQLWINVPAAHKGEVPFYQSAPKAALPVALIQEGVQLRLASGVYDGKEGPLKSYTPVVSMIGEIEKGRRVQLTATPGYWTLLYVIKGDITVNGETVPAFHLIVFEKDNEEIVVSAGSDSQILFLSAEPIDEPVAAKDNFVMNTKEEIDQALEDAKNGVFGTLNY